MKKKLTLFLIVSVFAANAMGQTYQILANENGDHFENERNDLYQLKLISKQLLLSSVNQNSSKLSPGEIIQITGGALIAGFILAITAFKYDIFTTLPLSLLGSGIALIFIGSSME